MLALPTMIPPRDAEPKRSENPNEVLLEAIGQILRRNPNATEHAIKTTLYAKHPDAARILAKTPSAEHEAKIVHVAIRLVKERAADAMDRAPREEWRRRTVWIG